MQLNPPTIKQLEYIELLRTRNKISASLFANWCREHYGQTIDAMDRRQASVMIDVMTTWTPATLPAELRRAAGQLDLFGNEVTS